MLALSLMLGAGFLGQLASFPLLHAFCKFFV